MIIDYFLLFVFAEILKMEIIFSVIVAFIISANFHFFVNRIYTFAYDVRPHLYVVLQRAGFKQESRLKNQYLHDNKYVDALIHSKFNYND